MKNKTIFLATAFVLIIVLAGLAYNFLKDNYQATPPQDNSQANDTSTTIDMKDFTVYDVDGKEVKLSSFLGKPIVVNFWASWCGPCKAEMPTFQAAYDKYKDDVNFVFVNMTDGSRETVDVAAKFLSDNNYTFPVYFDTDYDASTVYAVRSIPQTYFIDAEGKIIYSHLGMISEKTLAEYLPQK